MTIKDKDFLTAALLGFEQQVREIKYRMAEIDAELSGRSTVKEPEVQDVQDAGTGTNKPARKTARHRKKISAEGLERIRLAQKKRWAKVKKEKTTGAATVAAKKAVGKKIAKKPRTKSKPKPAVKAATRSKVAVSRTVTGKVTKD